MFSGEEDDLELDIIKKAISLGASDIHIETRESDVIIRLRTDGILSIERKIKINEYNVLLSKIKIKGNMDITEKRRPQDGKYSIVLNSSEYSLRVSTIPIIYGEKLVIRILYGMVFNYTIENLNLNMTQIKKLKRIMSLKNGLVIVNGPTGSGKSTTLYAMLQYINRDEINITTLEDPIETIIPGINQMNLNRKANITFANGLRNILRQDPDVIMVGEIRDEETAEIAVRASLTGHKVYSTIHTKTPRDIYLRLEDMGIKPYLIKDSLVGIVSQRLIKILCDDCKSKIKTIDIDGNNIDLYDKCGCIKCNNTGYKGRAMIAAIHIINSNIFQEIKSLNNDEMIDGLICLLKNGYITQEDFKDFIIMEGFNEKKYKQYFL
ncbi:GspE/PulE family protein [Clostridium chauvoei]|uniref:Putative General secretion pathway protein n=2 Tax=Clostridium chauvoei TaxID=46867 RepID=S6EZX3_9CLOT|nr:GspE/PulE family protein [Clostridium chauvoei]CDG01881.1 Putative General secretion pathway protein [Clostridium chauvoei JF4335]SLK18593.1 Putative General secretion pathway protein [Clostridium chauvoei JF4335]